MLGKAPQSCDCSALLRLPTEILEMIFYQAKDKGDRACLALSCRRFLRIASLHPPWIPSRDGVLSKAPRRTRRRRRLLCVLMGIPPRDEHGRRDPSWALCHECFRYRSTDPRRWMEEKIWWPEYVRKDWDSFVVKWAESGMPGARPCPPCSTRQVPVKAILAWSFAESAFVSGRCSRQR